MYRQVSLPHSTHRNPIYNSSVSLIQSSLKWIYRSRLRSDLLITLALHARTPHKKAYWKPLNMHQIKSFSRHSAALSQVCDQARGAFPNVSVIARDGPEMNTEWTTTKRQRPDGINAQRQGGRASGPRCFGQYCRCQGARLWPSIAHYTVWSVAVVWYPIPAYPLHLPDPWHLICRLVCGRYQSPSCRCVRSGLTRYGTIAAFVFVQCLPHVAGIEHVPAGGSNGDQFNIITKKHGISTHVINHNYRKYSNLTTRISTFYVDQLHVIRQE